MIKNLENPLSAVSGSGLTFPNLKLYELDSNTLALVDLATGLTYKYLALAGLQSSGAITLKPSGDTDDYFTFSTVADIPTITATGAAYLAFGSSISTSGAVFFGTDRLQLTEQGADIARLLNAGSTGYIRLNVQTLLTQTGIDGDGASPHLIRVLASDDAYWAGHARDNTVGYVEVWRMMSGADPYFQIGRDDTGVATNAVTDMLVLQAGAGTNNEAANFGLGISIKLGNAASEVEERASIDLVLVDATNASEDTRLNFNLQIAGAAPALVCALTGTGPIFPLLPNADPATAGMLYYIAATGVVMRSAG